LFVQLDFTLEVAVAQALHLFSGFPGGSTRADVAFLIVAAGEFETKIVSH